MSEIFIKYNPYKVETEITIDGEAIKINSALNVGDRRLQEWVEDLPEILRAECNTNDFKVTFHGTTPDYEDLVTVASNAKSQGIKIECRHIPAKEVKGKERAITQIFAEIQAGPFEELKQPDVVQLFQRASSSEFRVNVVATMSAGKSTLINALLQQKLMPAKQEACTATITEIKDCDSENFRATAYNKDGEEIEFQPELTLAVMNTLNENPMVSTIKVDGNIPFVSSEEVSLVLIDTPGPNNSRDLEHKVATYRMLSDPSKPLVLYIMNATQLAVNDDNDLLIDVAESMKGGGMQSKDRFIFVVNKLDDFKKDEDSVESAIDKVKKYLEDKGIINPNVFPATALTALNIRTSLQDLDLKALDLDHTSDDVYEVYGKIRKINSNEELHLEKYAPLTPSVRGEISNMLADARSREDKKEEALIHTGIISIEAAIRMYVMKYAKTAKIKNLVDAFSGKLESTEVFIKIANEISSKKEYSDEIKAQLDEIRCKIKSGENAKEFRERINAINYDKEIRTIADKVIEEAQKRISKQLSSSDTKMTRQDAEDICRVFEKVAETLQTEVQVKLENIITNHVQKNAQELLEQYRRRISNLTKDTGTVSIDALALMDGEIGSAANIPLMISGLVKQERVKTGERWVSNDNKKWYKPWTWFEESGHFTDVYEAREYIDGSELANKFFAPIQKQLYVNSDNAVAYAKRQAESIKEAFKKRFDELDIVLEKKTIELDAYKASDVNAEKAIAELQKKEAWLKRIESRIQATLDI